MKFDKKQYAIQKSAKNKPKNKQIFDQHKPKNKQPANLQRKTSNSQKTGPNSRENRNVGNTAEQFISRFFV